MISRSFARASAPVLLAALLLSGGAAPARAACDMLLPSPVFSTIPGVVLLVGRDATGQADPQGEFVVVVRNCANSVLSGRLVEISFLDCPSAGFASTGYPAGVTPDCRATRRSVRRVTDGNGEARFSIPGTVVPGRVHAADCLRVVAEGNTLLGQVRLATADLDGSSGVSAGDLSEFIAAFIEGNQPLADLDGDGVISGSDLSFWLGVFSGGGSLVTPTPLCP